MNSVSRKLSGVLGRRKQKEAFSLESRGNKRRNILTNESAHIKTDENEQKREAAFSSTRKYANALNDANKLNIYLQEHINRVNNSNNKYTVKRESSRDVSGTRGNFDSTFGHNNIKKIMNKSNRNANKAYDNFKSSNQSFAQNSELSKEYQRNNQIQSKQEL